MLISQVALREKIPNKEFFWSVFLCIGTEYGDLPCKSPYSVRIQENTDQKKLRIWTLFTQCGELKYCEFYEILKKLKLFLL